MSTDDVRDFAVMLAWAEIGAMQHCGGTTPLTAAARAEIDREGYERGDGTTVREQVETYCGGPLA